MIIPIGKNDWSYGNKNAIYEEMKKTKKFIKNYHPECKNIFISSLILCFHNKKAVSVLKSYINILKREVQNVFCMIALMNLICKYGGGILFYVQNNINPVLLIDHTLYFLMILKLSSLR